MSKDKNLFESIKAILNEDPASEIAKLALKSGATPSAEALKSLYRSGAKTIRNVTGKKPATQTPPASGSTPQGNFSVSSTPSAAPAARTTAVPPGAPPAKPVKATTISPKQAAIGIGTGAAIGAATIGAGYLAGKKASDDASAKGDSNVQPPIPQKPQRQAAAAAPKAAAPKERFIDTAAIYAKHGVGKGDEDAGAFHRAEAEIAAAKKANPTQIDPRSDVNRYAGRLTQQRADDEAAAKTPKPAPAPKAATPKPAPAAAPKAETPEAPKGPAAPMDASPISPQLTAPGMTSTFKKDTTPEQDIEASTKLTKPEGKKKVDESKLVQAFLSLQNSKHANIFEAAKKLSKKQDEKLDVVDDDKIDEKDFAALRAGKKKMEESKMADKDYDGDGKIESSKDEVWGSRLKAAKKAGKMEEGVNPTSVKIDGVSHVIYDPDNLATDLPRLPQNSQPSIKKTVRNIKGPESNVDEAAEPALKKSTTTDPDFAAPSANPDAPESPIKFVPKKEDEKPSTPPLPPKRPSGLKETYLNILKGK